MSRKTSNRRRRFMWSAQCLPGGRDYLEVLGGSGVDTSIMTRFIVMCGVQAEHGMLNSTAHISLFIFLLLNCSQQQYTCLPLVTFRSHCPHSFPHFSDVSGDECATFFFRWSCELSLTFLVYPVYLLLRRSGTIIKYRLKALYKYSCKRKVKTKKKF